MLPSFLSTTLLLLGQSAMPLQAPPPPQAPEPPPGFVDSPVATAPPDVSTTGKRRDSFARRIVPASYRSDAEPTRNTDLDDDVTTGTAAPPPPDADDIAAVLSPSRYLGKAAAELAQRDDGTPGQAPSVPSKTTASPQTGTTGAAPTASYTRPVVGYVNPAPATYTYGVGYGGGSVVGYSYPASYGYTGYAAPTYGTGYTYSVNADGSTTVCGPGGCTTGYGSAYGTTGYATARPGLFGRLFGRR